MNSNLFIAVHKPTGRLCIVRQELLGSQVMFKEKEIRLTCEVGSF